MRLLFQGGNKHRSLRPSYCPSQLILKLSAIILIFISYIFFPSCSAEDKRTLFIPNASLVDYLEAGDSGADIGNVAFGEDNYKIQSAIIPVPEVVEWPVLIPPGKSFLEFHVRYACGETTSPGGISVRISIDTGGRTEEIYSRRFWVRWQDRFSDSESVRVPLERYAGEQARFSFESSADDGVGQTAVVWGDPTIFVETRTELPNIVLICIDTLRRDHVQCYNTDIDFTPELQRLADDGVVFEHAISQSPWTLPSVSSVLTGLYPSLHGGGKRALLDSGLSHEELEALRRTRITHPFQGDVYDIQSLDSSVTTLPEMLADNYASYIANGNAFIADFANVSNRFRSYQDYLFSGYKLTRESNRWAERNRDKLFFLYAHYMEPHHWPTRYAELLGHRPRSSGRESALYTYREMVRIADEYVGDLLERLRELDLYDDSLIIFYSDHGEHFWDDPQNRLHGHGNTLSNILLEIPLIVKFPNSRFAGARVDTYVQLIDIFRTIAEAAGVEIGASDYRHCESLGSIAENPEAVSERDFISEYLLYYRERLAVQRGGYRMIYNFNNERFHLVDAASDQRLDVDSSDETRRAAEYLEGVLRSYLAEIESAISRPGREAIELGDTEVERLRDLGYLR